ncbi:MAG: bifunctional 5,10-methylene-tetrahydrofolate dehydrogenase/5,10-methylene-tetrahydrofolate cyclohydrolase [Candidatus Komeilibacteria bacterium]|nr:bifunctional 5,10-methylene-tetrahydrofolate dehydrogenase/5,10-methylene-tetrahydrofolate cyclohydrolase [Candidatus Komeilibacteria bacterium]
MSATVLLGTEISARIKQDLATRVNALRSEGTVPGILMIRVGDDPASMSYVRQKDKTAAEIGIVSKVVELAYDTPERTLLALIGHGNEDPLYHGILVQLPLPSHINQKIVANTINPLKDVDCFHPQNVGRLLMGDPYLIPCTPHAVLQILLQANKPSYWPEGKHVVVVGRSNLVGKPLAALLVQKNLYANATMTVCHSGTRNLSHHTAQADILVCAMGSPRSIKPFMIKEDAVVIDVGVTRIEDPSAKGGYRLVGDVDHESIDDDFATIADKAAAYTPVPGGVGPMTVTMLMWNTVKAAEFQRLGAQLGVSA